MRRPEDPTRCRASEMNDDHGRPDDRDMVTPTLPKKLKLSALVDLSGDRLIVLAGGGSLKKRPDMYTFTIFAEIDHGLHDPANLDARVKWVACFREVVALRCPKNAVGTAIVSDLDLLQASARERLITFILWKSNHYKP